jgi:hypothetical protein
MRNVITNDVFRRVRIETAVKYYEVHDVAYEDHGNYQSG